MTSIAERFPTLTRHWQILTESWKTQTLTDRAFRPRSDHEFLPAALEIIEKPASPALRRLLQLICAMFVFALAWSVLGKVDVVAVASGKTVPTGSVKVVQPIEIGTVRAIHVRNGEFVHKGDLLVELDPTLATADEAQSRNSLLSAQIEQARNSTLLAYAEGRPAIFILPPGTSDEIIGTQQSFVRSTIAQYEAERASLTQQRAEKSAELVAANAEVAKLVESMPYLERQLAARSELARKGYYSKLQLLEYEQLRAERLRDIDVQRAHAEQARAAVGTLEAEMRSLRSGLGKTAVSDLTEAADKAGLATEELRKSIRRREYQQVRAPIDGVVQQLRVTTIGGVVQPAQPLMVIVPCRAQGSDVQCGGSIEVEVFVENKDIGFIHPGQRVAVKLEAFNFTDYGLIDGLVSTVSRDAVDRRSEQSENVNATAAQAASAGLVYVAKITLKCDPKAVNRTSLCDHIQPGMAVQAEIKTGTRRIIQYLLSPISKAMTEAGRER